MTTPFGLAALLESDLDVNASYRHGPKMLTIGAAMRLPHAMLKWYLLAKADAPVPDLILDLARAHLLKEGHEAQGFGFVVLHRCGEGFYFLIVSTWRNENELWQTVWYKNGDAMADFALFPRDGEHKPTFCVWELAAVGREVSAWNRFLASSRDEPAITSWLADQQGGAA